MTHVTQDLNFEICITQCAEWLAESVWNSMHVPSSTSSGEGIKWHKLWYLSFPFISNLVKYVLSSLLGPPRRGARGHSALPVLGDDLGHQSQSRVRKTRLPLNPACGCSPSSASVHGCYHPTRQQGAPSEAPSAPCPGFSPQTEAGSPRESAWIPKLQLPLSATQPGRWYFPICDRSSAQTSLDKDKGPGSCSREQGRKGKVHFPVESIAPCSLSPTLPGSLAP